MGAESKTSGRVPLLERDQVPAEVAAVYDALQATRGVVPNMFKTVAHAPALAVAIAGLLKALLSDGALPGWYKELIATRMSLLNESEYAVRAHSISARQKGASQAQIEGVKDYEQGPFSEAEKLGLRFADRLHRSGREIDETFYSRVASVYNHQQIVELTVAAAAFELFPRLVDGLRIAITPPPAGGTKKV
jgi:AhpD family alkylhydroperoxidase